LNFEIESLHLFAFGILTTIALMLSGTDPHYVVYGGDEDLSITGLSRRVRPASLDDGGKDWPRPSTPTGIA